MTAGCCQLAIFDANLNQVFTRTNNSDFIENNLLYSLDGSRLYLSANPTSNTEPIIRVLETATFTEVGQVPDLQLDGLPPSRPVIRALTDDGFILGSAERGMSLVDSAAIVPQLPSISPRPAFEGLGPLQPSHVNVGSRSTSMVAGFIEFTPQIFFWRSPGHYRKLCVRDSGGSHRPTACCTRSCQREVALSWRIFHNRSGRLYLRSIRLVRKT